MWETGALLPLNVEQEQWFEIQETIPVAQIKQGQPQSIDVFWFWFSLLVFQQRPPGHLERAGSVRHLEKTESWGKMSIKQINPVLDRYFFSFAVPKFCIHIELCVHEK